MKIIKSSAIIIGAIIGAGFASGKEIFEYFAKYGIYSLLFIIPLFLIFAFFIYIYLSFGQKTFGLEYKNCNKLLCKDIKIFSKKFNPFNFMLCTSFLILSSAMFSALIALLETYFNGGSKFLFFAIAIIITIILIKLPFDKFGIISNIIVPLIVFCIILTVACSFSSNNFVLSFGSTNLLPLPFLTIAYVSQNTFFCSFVIIKLGHNLTKKQRISISCISSGVLSGLILLGILCFLFNPSLIYSDMPFAQVAIGINPLFSVVFAIILLGSIITTYVTSLASLKEYFKIEKKHNNVYLLLFIIVLISLLNFGNIVEYLYPIIGAFGFAYFCRVCAFKNAHKSLNSFNFFLQKPNKEIHSASQQAKHNRAS